MAASKGSEAKTIEFSIPRTGFLLHTGIRTRSQIVLPGVNEPGSNTVAEAGPVRDKKDGTLRSMLTDTESKTTLRKNTDFLAKLESQIKQRSPKGQGQRSRPVSMFSAPVGDDGSQDAASTPAGGTLPANAKMPAGSSVMTSVANPVIREEPDESTPQQLDTGGFDEPLAAYKPQLTSDAQKDRVRLARKTKVKRPRTRSFSGPSGAARRKSVLLAQSQGSTSAAGEGSKADGGTTASQRVRHSEPLLSELVVESQPRRSPTQSILKRTERAQKELEEQRDYLVAQCSGNASPSGTPVMSKAASLSDLLDHLDNNPSAETSDDDAESSALGGLVRRDTRKQKHRRKDVKRRVTGSHTAETATDVSPVAGSQPHHRLFHHGHRGESNGGATGIDGGIAANRKHHRMSENLSAFSHTLADKLRDMSSVLHKKKRMSGDWAEAMSGSPEATNLDRRKSMSIEVLATTIDSDDGHHGGEANQGSRSGQSSSQQPLFGSNTSASDLRSSRSRSPRASDGVRGSSIRARSSSPANEVFAVPVVDNRPGSRGTGTSARALERKDEPPAELFKVFGRRKGESEAGSSHSAQEWKATDSSTSITAGKGQRQQSAPSRTSQAAPVFTPAATASAAASDSRQGKRRDDISDTQEAKPAENKAARLARMFGGKGGERRVEAKPVSSSQSSKPVATSGKDAEEKQAASDNKAPAASRVSGSRVNKEVDSPSDGSGPSGKPAASVWLPPSTGGNADVQPSEQATAVSSMAAPSFSVSGSKQPIKSRSETSETSTSEESSEAGPEPTAQEGEPASLGAIPAWKQALMDKKKAQQSSQGLSVPPVSFGKAASPSQSNNTSPGASPSDRRAPFGGFRATPPSSSPGRGKFSAVPARTSSEQLTANAPATSSALNVSPGRSQTAPDPSTQTMGRTTAARAVNSTFSEVSDEALAKMPPWKREMILRKREQQAADNK